MAKSSTNIQIGILTLTERRDIQHFTHEHAQPGIVFCQKILEFTDLQNFVPPSEWKAVILLHSAKLGRVSLTDVPDARYDKLMEDLDKAYKGKEAICVIAHDVNNYKKHSREEQLLNLKCAQKSAFKYSANIIICDALNNLDTKDSEALDKFLENVHRAGREEELKRENATAKTEPDVEKEDEAYQGKVVLVTDASGFVASHIVKKLLQNGCRVRVTLRKSSSIKDLPKEWGNKLETVEADISETDRLKEIVRGCTHVIHTADLFPDRADQFTDVNKAKNVVRGLLRACLDVGGVKRVIVTGACDFAKDDNIKENYSPKDWEKLNSILKDAYWKASTAKEARLFNAGQKITLSIIRSPVTMGPIYFPVDKTKVEMIRRLQDNIMARNIHFPMCDVRDVADAYIVALKDETAVGICVSVTHDVISYNRMRDIIREKFDHNGKGFQIMLSSFGVIDNETTKALDMLYSDEKCYFHGKKWPVLVKAPISMKTTFNDMVQSYLDHGLINFNH